MSVEQSKERAFKKIETEIHKEVSLIINLAKECSIGELFFFIHYLHFIRLIPYIEDNQGKITNTTRQYINQSSDANKYLIQLIKKHYQYVKISDGKYSEIVDVGLVQSMLQVYFTTNGKYAMKSFIYLTPELEISGERDQHLKIDMNLIISDPIASKYFYYYQRLERDNQYKINNSKTKDDFIQAFEHEYKPFEDLFEKAFSIKLEEYINFINWSLNKVTTEIYNNEDKFEKLGNGKFDIQSQKTMFYFVSSLFINKGEIKNEFGEEMLDKIKFMIFKEKNFDEYQYRYDLVTRQPILELGDDILLFSPELLLDSLYLNVHYSLLENSNIKNQYIKRYASVFIDKIVQLANTFGFTEVTREFDLYDGKDQIGDIDLLLKNDDEFHLLIEAKYHSLPLDVYFQDYEATQKRLKNLQKDWEKKVKRRKNHLDIKHNNYNIPSTYLYLIVTKHPEILSHFSDIIVLSIEELESWFKIGSPSATFQDVFDTLYTPDHLNDQPDENEVIKSEFFPGIEFRKE